MPRRKLIPNEETYTLSLRLPIPMKKKLEERAIANRRSLNQEVISLLQYAFEQLEKEQTPKAEKPLPPD